MKSKRGQMKMSFGMIFSIILIVLFLVLAFYGIKAFINFQKDIQLKQFQENLELEIERIWKDYGTKTFGDNNILPSNVERVCFKEQNVLEVRLKDGRRNIDLENIDVVENFCVEPVNNKISFTLSKAYNEGPLVKVTE